MMNKKEKRQSKTRIPVVLIIIFICFVILVVQLVIVQIVNGGEYAAKQEAYTVATITTTAVRGSIYDCNGNLLALDASCSKITAWTAQVTDPETEATILSEKLDGDYDTIYALLTSDTQYVTIETNVSNSIALEIEEADLDGITIEDDEKRYYTDSNFAQYILGFTGTDHVGLYGIEAVYDGILGGEDGIETVITDANGNALESTTTVQKEASAGDDVVLTIDSVMQYYAEEAVYEAYIENDAERVMAIVTDPNTGEVLAMAAYPAYDLDSPWTVTEDFLDSYDGDTSDLSEMQLEMWKNPFTSFIYEPGSTFKVITVSSALQENIVNLQSTFYCNGYVDIGGVRIKCWVYPEKHGDETLTQAVANSCNVAMISIAREMGPDIFYRYIHAYGFGEPTGIDLDSEESGILTESDDVNIVDFVTLSFGQGIGVTPIQMIQALNAAINGGELLEPHVLKYVLDHDTGEIISEEDTTVVRQVISEETSEEMRGILKAAADSYTTISQYSDLEMGAKTGTAQKYINGSYASGLYVASFYCFAPYDDPELSVLVLVDEPGGNLTSGSTVAAPIGAEILNNCYNYLQSTKVTSEDSSVTEETVIPDLRGQTKADAASVLDSLGISYALTGDDDGIIVDQDLIQETYESGTTVTLTVASTDGDKVAVPNLTGMTVANATSCLDAMGLNIEVSGSGIASKQGTTAGTLVTKGTTVQVTFSALE